MLLSEDDCEEGVILLNIGGKKCETLAFGRFGTLLAFELA